MRLRQKLIATILFQLIGTLSTVLVSVVVARRYGPTGQGFLSYYRSAVDLLANIGLFGFPQAFTFLINAKMVSVGWAVKFSNRYSVLFGALLGIVAFITHVSGIAEKNGFNLIGVMSLAFASLGMTLHGMYRAICLSTKSNYLFNIVSILPAAATLIIYLAWNTPDYNLLVLASVGASAVSVMFPMLLFKEHLSGKWNLEKDLAVSAAKYGFWSLVPSVTASVTIVGTYTLLRQGGASEATSGNFSISLLFLTAGIVPLNMVAPILFNDWAGERWKQGARHSYALLAHMGLMVSVAGLLLAFIFVGPLTETIFGNKFFESVESTRVLLFGVFPFYQNRLLTPISLAIGNPYAVAISSLIRMTAVFVFLYFSSSLSLVSTAFGWVLGELFGMLFMCGVVARKTGWPIMEVAGVSPFWVFGKIKSIYKHT